MDHLFTKEWIIDNFIAEIFFGIILLGMFTFLWRYVKDAYRAIRVYGIISTHNNSTRTRRKGSHVLDRFMDIYESKKPVNSRTTVIYGPGEAGGFWSEQSVDKGVLEYHGLVIVRDSSNGKVTEAYRNRYTRWVYGIAKWIMERERRRTDELVTNKSGKWRKLSE